EVGAAQVQGGTSVELTRTDGQVPAAPEVYAARIRATIPLHDSAWVTAPAVEIMPVPQVDSVAYADGAVTVGWTPLTDPAVSFDVELTLADQQPVTATVTGTAPDPAPGTARIDMTGQPRGGYLAQVRARADNSIGDWSAPLPVAVLDPPAQDGLSARYAHDEITVTWLPVAEAAGYQVDLLDPAGAVARSSAVPGTEAGAPPPP